MRTFLNSLLAAALATFTAAVVTVDTNAFGARAHVLDGKVSSEHLLFQDDAPSRLTCASRCTKHGSCVAFSTSPKHPSSNTLLCRGHLSKSVSQTSLVGVPGSKTYFLNRRQSDDDLTTEQSAYALTTEPAGSSWLERPCTSDSDCPASVANVLCFPTALKCLCQPGYYYSHSTNACVPVCAAEDLQSTFVRYPHRYMHGNNIAIISNCATFEKGSKRCLSYSDCRTFDIWSADARCFLHSVTALTLSSSFKNNILYDHYQRTCL